MSTRGVDVARMCEIVTLPEGTQWLEVGGQIVFPVIGVSGGLQAEFRAYLLDSKRMPADRYDLGTAPGLVDDERGRWFVIRFALVEDHHSVTAKFKEAFEAMNGN